MSSFDYITLSHFEQLLTTKTTLLVDKRTRNVLRMFFRMVCLVSGCPLFKTVKPLDATVLFLLSFLTLLRGETSVGGCWSAPPLISPPYRFVCALSRANRASSAIRIMPVVMDSMVLVAPLIKPIAICSMLSIFSLKNSICWPTFKSWE